MTIAFKTEGINYNTMAADIVSHYSNFHINTVSSSVALFWTDAHKSFITVEFDGFYLFIYFILLLGGRIISISVTFAISGHPHLLTVGNPLTGHFKCL